MKYEAGMRFGKLTSVRFDHMRGKHSYWLFKCDCGNEIIARMDCVVNGNTKSCGCLIHEIPRGTHGYSRTKLYHVYYAMKQRCYNPNDRGFKWYGAKGIKIDDTWNRDFLSFREWAISHGYKEGLTIDRIDVNGNYSPENCRWITQHNQCRNTTRNTHITINGETKLLCEWCEETGVNASTACQKLKKGIKPEEVFHMTGKV